MKTLKSILILMSVWALSACATTDHGQFSVMSLWPIDKEKTYKKVAENITGTDTGIYWAFYGAEAKLDAALADALKKFNGDYMTNVRVKWTFWVIPIVYGENTFELIGDVWRADTSSSTSPKPAPTQTKP